MNDTAVTRIHWSFWVIGVVALLFNVGGIINFFMQTNPDTVAEMRDSFRLIVEGRPGWATGAFAIAVFGGALGSLLLLLRKSVAYYLLIASLLGVIVQTIPFLRMIGSPLVFDPLEVIMAFVVSLAFAAFLVWYSKHVERKGWVSQGANTRL